MIIFPAVVGNEEKSIQKNEIKAVSGNFLFEFKKESPILAFVA